MTPGYLKTIGLVTKLEEQNQQVIPCPVKATPN